MYQELAVRSDAGGLLSYGPSGKERKGMATRPLCAQNSEAPRFAGHAAREPRREFTLAATGARVARVVVVEQCQDNPELPFVAQRDRQ